MIKTIELVRIAEPSDWIASGRKLAGDLPDGARPRGLLYCAVRPGRRQIEADGVVVSWFDDDAQRLSFLERAPEERLLGVRVEERIATAPEWVRATRADTGTSALLLVAFLQRLPSVTRPQYADYWWGNHRPLADRDVPEPFAMRGYVHNYVVPDDPSEWDGIGELYEQSLDIAKQRTAWMSTDDGAAALRVDETRFMRTDTRRVLVTEQHVVIPVV